VSAFPAALLLQGGAGQPSPFGFLLPMALVFLIFYFLLIRPQTKRQREHDAMIRALGKGDRVVLRGGIHGTITGTAEELVTVEIANLRGERVRVKADRAGVERLVEKAASGDEP
jgi:preprotein translocase subunit YajC